MVTMSDQAWVALAQLKRQEPVWDGDLVSKRGRTELIEMGFAHREDGFTYLTKDGRALVMRMSPDDWQGTSERRQ